MGDNGQKKCDYYCNGKSDGELRPRGRRPGYTSHGVVYDEGFDWICRPCHRIIDRSGQEAHHWSLMEFSRCEECERVAIRGDMVRDHDTRHHVCWKCNFNKNERAEENVLLKREFLERIVAKIGQVEKLAPENPEIQELAKLAQNITGMFEAPTFP
ncbi:hypothetical protein QKT49_gp327 [Acanthamoeba castellanii medusavirus]|uniref:Uncharacterized protein n=1 Tax=Acanthamoeba castellanii medusavirus J1 TaxID=3114988 RepID=A0A3T1CX81_9VIRU|nr:hypothetical protein QKT49_gp327 [Acanthamoeba castellanii medusavirus]BBI30436.1 hypothetical protein [Acanthamoeba castellanii medusavirus J1]